MDFALDPTTREIVYPPAAVRSRRYLCPSCEKPVTVRGIDRYSLRVPYFAHLKGKADKDCDKFFHSVYSPSYIDGFDTSIAFQPLISRTLTINQLSIVNTTSSKNLYLKVDDEVFKLYLVIQLYGVSSNWDGKICINSLNGVREFKSNNVFGKHFPILVDLNFNESCIQKDGNVDNFVWDFFTIGIPKITGLMDFFHAPYSTGRLLKSHESLFIGETYIISSLLPLNIPIELLKFIEKQYKINAINFYQIFIPDGLSEKSKDHIEKVFSRKIFPTKPSLKLFDPLPEFIDVDGTVHVARNSKKLVIAFDCDRNDLDWILIGGVTNADTVKIYQNYLVVDATNIIGIELFCFKSRMLRIEKSYTKPFEIDGVTIGIAGNQYNLIDFKLNDQFTLDKEFTVDSSWLSVNKVIKITQRFNPVSELQKNGLYRIIDGLEIDAGAFGYINFFNSIKDIQVDEKNEKNSLNINPKEKWLKTISLLSCDASNKKLVGSLDSLCIGISHQNAINKLKIEKR